MIERLKFDIDPLVNEILDEWDPSVWTSTTSTFLDPAIGSGQFVKEIERRLRANGHSKKNISKRVFGCEKSRLRVQYAVNTHKLVGTYFVNDFVNQGFNMKVDNIVGNPPFQRNNNKAKRWTLWEEFVNKSLEIADNVALVVPQSVTSPNSAFNSIKDKCSVLNVDVGKHFSVSSTFCYFVAHKNKKINQTKIITSQSVYSKDISNVPFLPLVINPDTLSQLDDLVARPKKKWYRGELHTSKTQLFNAAGKYSVMHTNAQTLRTDVEHKNKTKIRVAVSLSGYPTFRVLQNEYASQACFWTEFNSVKEAQAFADECNSKEIQDTLAVFKWSGWNSKEVIECL